MPVQCQDCGYVSQPSETDPDDGRCPVCNAIDPKLQSDHQMQAASTPGSDQVNETGIEAQTEDADWDDDTEERLWLAAAGQKILIQCILLSLVLNAAGRTQEIPALVLFAASIAISVYSLIGILRICSGLEKTQNKKILFMVLAFLPIAGLITMVYLSVKTTGLLRKAGWTVGLFGGKP